MTTIVDLGGAPANEPCAQLGQTPDFAALNSLEVEALKAALQARFGVPPAGCRFVPIDNHHDFGRYRTLGLALDRPDDPSVGAYAEAVEEGLGSWGEAGFSPPINYCGAAGHAPRDLAEIVVGALATTRPDFDGRYPLAEFAALHRNLRAAYPAEAESFDVRIRASVPARVMPVDPRLFDEAGTPLPDTALARAVCRAAIDAAAPHLDVAGIAQVVIDYNGGGDEGQINDVTAEAADGTSVSLPTVACERFTTGYDGRVTSDVTSLEAALEAIGTEALGAYYQGWENNDGAFGTIRIDVAARTATLDHNIYVTSSELFTTEL